LLDKILIFMKLLLENYHQLSKIIPELAVPPCGYKPPLLCVKPPKRIYIMHDIVDTAVAAGSFKTLVAAVTAAGLVDTLGSGPLKSTFAASRRPSDLTHIVHCHVGKARLRTTKPALSALH
jgi:hypothetical protein